MESLKVIGFGYFGKPEIVARIFEKTVETYTVSYDVPRLACIQAEVPTHRIKGFTLGFEKEMLNVSIFSADSSLNRRTYKRLAPIRKNRLN